VIDFGALRQRIIEGERNAALDLTRASLDAGVPADVIFQRALVPAMERVGELMQAHEYFLPEVLMAARAMQAASLLLRPHIVSGAVMTPIGTAVACTVAGDLHDIGKNLVCMMLEGAGFTVVNLGNNCSAEKVVAAVREHRPDVLALSAMLTTTMLQMAGVIEALRQAGLRGRVHVMVGGAPVGADFAREIGADFYSNHAAAAASHAKEYVATRVR
jgi:5-methyltetrahydrofolate--homocysteine methyltransferase